MLEQVPTRGYLGLAAVGLACSLVTTAAVVASPAQSVPEDYELDPELAVAPVEPLDPVAPTVASAATRDELPDTSVQLIFTFAGTSYVALQDLDDAATPDHGKLRRAKDEYIEGVVARVAASEVPAWRGRKVIVDGTCTTTLRDFAIVSRLTGDPGYAGLDGSEWTTRQIFDEGKRVLVAKLDGCTGTYARDSSASPTTLFEDVVDTEHAAEARARVLASQPAADLATTWSQANMPGSWTDGTELVTKVVRDPRSATTWISVHGYQGSGCGDPDINIWGLFRVEADGSLATVQVRHMDTLTSIDKLVDLDNDGVPELIGKAWLGPSTVIFDLEGNELGREDVPFFGCPC